MEKVLEVFVVTIVLAAAPYLIGIVYLSAYFGYFDISMSEIELSQQEYLFGAATAIASMVERATIDNSGIQVLVVGTLTVLLLLVGWRLLRELTSKAKFILPAIMLFFVVFIVLLLWASKLGVSIARDNVGSFASVLILQVDDVNEPVKDLDMLIAVQIFDVKSDRLIYASKSSYFVLRQFLGLSSFTVLRIPRNDDIIALEFDVGSKP